MKNVLFVGLLMLGTLSLTFAQGTCTSNPATIASSINFSALSWTSSGGASCPPSANFTGNVTINIGDGVTVTMDSDITINGNFNITNNGTSTLSIPAGIDVHVTGDMGDANNNDVQYVVNGTLQVDGTLYGKNNNAFSGSGSISGGTLDVKNGSTCGTPCPVTGGFNNCNSNDSFCTTYGVTLPITLLNFDAVVLQETIELKWTTILEENFQKFIIQRSGKGIVFNDIGEVAGAGKNIYDIESHYSFEDKSPLLGYNYYRLKAMDLDGKYEIFDVLAARLSGNKNLFVYPNPSFGESISFSINFNPSENDYVLILDQVGSEIARVRVTDTKNLITFRNKLRPGIYSLKYFSPVFEKAVLVIIKP